jgi:hypothetical protein
VQLPLLQVVPPAVHVLPQHGCPAPPHATHVVPAPQVAPVAVHEPPGQQVCVKPPHVPQLPLEHVPPTPGHVAAGATHALFTQHPPPPHALPAQHG